MDGVVGLQIGFLGISALRMVRISEDDNIKKTERELSPSPYVPVEISSTDVNQAEAVLLNREIMFSTLCLTAGEAVEK